MAGSTVSKGTICVPRSEGVGQLMAGVWPDGRDMTTSCIGKGTACGEGIGLEVLPTSGTV